MEKWYWGGIFWEKVYFINVSVLGTYILIVSPVIGHSSAHHTLIAPWAPERQQHI